MLASAGVREPTREPKGLVRGRQAALGCPPSAPGEGRTEPCVTLPELPDAASAGASNGSLGRDANESGRGIKTV